MFYINWQLGLVMVLILPTTVVIASVFQKRILIQFRKARKLNSKLTGVYNENITGVRVVKALVREGWQPIFIGRRIERPGCRRCSCRSSRSSVRSDWV